MVQLAWVLMGIYLLVVVVVFVGQRRFIYFPSRMSLEGAIAEAHHNGLDPWTNSSGQLIGWRHLSKSQPAQARMLITHGNAGSAGDRAAYVPKLNLAWNCDVFILEYPGYGPRPGSPSQESLFRAADGAIGLLGSGVPLYLVGESLGTGVAAYIAGTYPQAIAGLLMIAPYKDLGDVAQRQMPWVPAKWLLSDRFPSGRYLHNYHGPVAVLLAGQDEVIPKDLGRALYESYSGPKKLWEVPLARHNDLPDQPDDWWKELAAFWKSAHATKP